MRLSQTQTFKFELVSNFLALQPQNSYVFEEEGRALGAGLTCLSDKHFCRNGNGFCQNFSIFSLISSSKFAATFLAFQPSKSCEPISRCTDQVCFSKNPKMTLTFQHWHVSEDSMIKSDVVTSDVVKSDVVKSDEVKSDVVKFDIVKNSSTGVFFLTKFFTKPGENDCFEKVQQGFLFLTAFKNSQRVFASLCSRLIDCNHHG